MNNLRKYKKKKQKKITKTNQTIDDQQKLATENLFNISDCYDLSNKKQLNPETNLFNSTSLSQSLSQTLQKPHKKTTIIKLRQNQSNPLQELERFVDHQFIQQSKNLLHLYSTDENQNSLKTPIAHRKNVKTNSRQIMHNNKAKEDLFCNSFNSDCVFVIKRKNLTEKFNSENKQSKCPKRSFSFESKMKKKITEQPDQITEVANIDKMGYPRPHKNYFQSSPKKFPKSIHGNEPHKNRPEYGQIPKFKTLNSIKWFLLSNSIEKSSQSIRLSPERQVKKLIEKSKLQFSLSKSEEKSCPFQKIYTLYKDRKIKQKICSLAGKESSFEANIIISKTPFNQRRQNSKLTQQ